MTQGVDSIEGKTKIIEVIDERGEGDVALGRVTSKDVLTAGDGDRIVEAPGKGYFATRTNIHVMERLAHHGVPLAFYRADQYDAVQPSFLVELVDMIPVEVVVCNAAAENGSYSKRNPDVPEGTIFDQPVLQFFYKTADKRFKATPIEKDDPFMIFSDDGTRLSLHHPQRQIDHERPMVDVGYEHMSVKQRIRLRDYLHYCGHLALDVNRHLSSAWAQHSGRLIDFKIECGITSAGQIVVADVIDCDSWRVECGGQQLSKQKFRDGSSLDEVMRVYQLAHDVTRSFQY